MALIIQKFGGSSVANLDKIAQVAQIVKRTRDAGHQVVVVVSAMYGETDRLIQLARAASHQAYGREYDALLATGEQVSAALMSMTLMALDCPARSYNASQARILTNDYHGKATIIDVDTNPLQTILEQGIVPVVAGFQGINKHNDMTTIGRGGSDLTAVMLAAVLKADECQIFTDVDGVYTSDPRIVKAARRLTYISFDEMHQLARLGAKVLQKNAVELAERHAVPLRVLSSFEPGPGTLVVPYLSGEQTLLSGIAFDKNQAKVSISGVPAASGMIDSIIGTMQHEAIDMDMFVQNSTATHSPHLDIRFTVPREDFDQALSIAHYYSQHWQVAQVIGDNSIAKLSLVGLGMKSHAGMASKAFYELTQQGIDVHLITSSEMKVSTVIAEQHMELGACILHAIFQLDSVNAGRIAESSSPLE